MRIVQLTCPSCGANLNVDVDNKQAHCQFCGATFPVDDEVLHVHYDNAGQAGYEFEKGRQQAQIEYAQAAQQAQMPQQPKKRRTWLWVLGWIFIFPVPLTILMLRNKKLDQKVRIAIIVVAWVAYLFIGFAGNNSNTTSTQTDTGDAIEGATAQEPVLGDDQATAILDGFVDAYNESATSQFDSLGELGLEDISSEASGYIKWQIDRDWPESYYWIGHSESGSYLHPENYLAVVMYTESEVPRIRVVGMFDDYDSMVDAFVTSIRLISSEITDDDINQLIANETFIYGGKGGEIRSVTYDVSGYGGYHTIFLDAPADNLNFQQG